MEEMVEDYPRTLAELESRFSREQACREYLFRLRWPEGFRCSRCDDAKAWPLRSGLWQGSRCGYQISVTAGTIFQDTRTPLTVWFRAMWWVTSQKNGVSALGLQRVLDLGSYQTAWAWLHKLRRAMVRPGRERLSGKVEVDETYLGGLEEGVRGRQTDSKALIVVAAQEAGHVVHTDGWLGYAPLQSHGYVHKISFLRGNKQSPSELLPRVHWVVSLLKRWLLGTHQGAVSIEHLDYYLDEFTFRFNRRKSRSRGKLFFRLVQQAVAAEPTTYRSIIESARTDWSPNHNLLGGPE
jgi:transposase-like protein